MTPLSYKWQRRFLSMAEHVASWSRDPSTQVGAIIIRPNKSVCSVGFNGFPQGVDDSVERYANRELKYELCVHAETNAIAFAQEPLTGYTLFTYPFMPCTKCAGLVIQSGIKQVISIEMTDDLASRWADSLKKAEDMFAQAGVMYSVLPIIDPNKSLIK